MEVQGNKTRALNSLNQNRKTKAQLIIELTRLNKRLMKFERQECEHKGIQKEGIEHREQLEKFIVERTTALRKSNEELRKDISEQELAGEALLEVRDDLAKKVGERTAALLKVNKLLKQEIAAHKNAEEKVLRQATLLEAINTVFQEALTCDTDGELTKKCLWVAEKLTGSKFGFIGEFNAEGLLDTLAISNPGWDACKLDASKANRQITNMPISEIVCATMRDGESRIVGKNEFAAHPNRVSFPEGHPHPPVNAFLGVPLKYEGKSIGMIGLCNKEGGYDTFDQKSVESLSVAVVEAFSSKRREINLRNALAALERKKRLTALGELSGGVAHELRNPLGVISNAVYFLQMALTDADQKTNEYLGIIASEVRNAEKTISGLLDFSRIKTSRCEGIAVTDIICKTMDRNPLPEIINLTVKLDPGLPLVNIDRQQVVQVFSNLLSNACHAMPEGGNLTIRAFLLKGKVCISVTDTGIGMSKAVLKKIFEPLFTTRVQGIGLGLSISKNMLESNGASIEAESNEGEGSTFRVFLPIQKGIL